MASRNVDLRAQLGVRYSKVMRTLSLAACCALAALIALTAFAQSRPRLTIDENDVDVANRTIHFTLGTVAQSAEIQVFSPDGELLHVGVQEYDAPAPNTRLAVSWPDLGDKGENFRIELKITDSKDNWIGFQVIRFYLEVPHKEVVFPTAKWEIPKDEQQKLAGPLSMLKETHEKYGELMNISLYVTGHTDTVGKAKDNQVLSEKRARSIARYFIERGLKGIPVYVRGFGEGALAVATGDNVAEKRNRRAQYIISSFTPQLSGPGTFRRVQ